MEKKKKRPVYRGIAAAMAASALLVCCIFFYQDTLRQTQAQSSGASQLGLETQDKLRCFLYYNYVLYGDLYNWRNRTSASYARIYRQEGNYLDFVETYRGLLLERESGGYAVPGTDQGISEDLDARKADPEKESWLTYRDGDEYFFYRDRYYLADEENYDSALWHYGEASSSFNSCLEYWQGVLREDSLHYWIQDGSDPELMLSNAGGDQAPEKEQYPFLIQYIYDEEGRVSLGQVTGEDLQALASQLQTLIRRDILYDRETNGLGSFLAGALESYEVYRTLAEDASYMAGPQNCVITYGIPKALWDQMKEDAENSLTINGAYGVYYNYDFENAAPGLLLLCMFFGFFFSNAVSRERQERLELPRIPLEAVLCLTVLLAFLYQFLPEAFLYAGVWKRWPFFPVNPPELQTVLGYGWVSLLAFAFFFTGWYMGSCLGEVLCLGLGGYLKKRSLCYRVFPFTRRKCREFFESYLNINLTKKTRKKLFWLLFVNGLLCFVFCLFWAGGIFGILLYSAVLYLILGHFLEQVRERYQILLQATNRIGQGELNVVIPENLGPFEPFKPELYKIQNGFKRAVEEEVKSQRMKAELITNVSHDLKTPLTAIITYINLLKEENLTKEQRDQYLDTLERKSLRLKVLIEDLFEVSKANSGSVSLQLVAVDLCNLLKQVHFEQADKLSERGLDVRMRLPERKVLLMLDSQKTYRIYENLFGNIAKYAMAGTRVYVDLEEGEELVTVTLKNIAEQEISVSPEELTERFVRGDSARGSEGSGLGLSIVKSFTELQGGTLSIEIDGDLFKAVTCWKRTV